MQLSVEQLQQIEQNRRTALERLAIRNVPVPVGESWRREIGTEFTKPYFTKVNDARYDEALQKRRTEVKMLMMLNLFLFCFSAHVICYNREEMLYGLSQP